MTLLIGGKEMEWIDVQTDLPKDGEQVLGLVEGYFSYSISDICQKRSFRIFQCTFCRFVGWEIPFYTNTSCPYVRYWMKKPADPVLE